MNLRTYEAFRLKRSACGGILLKFDLFRESVDACPLLHVLAPIIGHLVIIDAALIVQVLLQLLFLHLLRSDVNPDQVQPAHRVDENRYGEHTGRQIARNVGLTVDLLHVVKVPIWVLLLIMATIVFADGLQYEKKQLQSNPCCKSEYYENEAADRVGVPNFSLATPWTTLAFAVFADVVNKDYEG